jgi:hypothetical protein
MLSAFHVLIFSIKFNFSTMRSKKHFNCKQQQINKANYKQKLVNYVNKTSN